jgi:hypothetical protein
MATASEEGRGGTWTLPRLVSPAAHAPSRSWLNQCPPIRPKPWGLIWKAHDDGELMAQAHALCAGLPPQRWLPYLDQAPPRRILEQ